MRLSEYLKSRERITMSKKPIEKLNFPVRQPSDWGVGGKPLGLWYGFGSSWLDWVESEMPDWRGEYFYYIDVDKNKVLRLSKYTDLLQFTSDYKDRKVEYNLIDWQKVAKKYSGIEINPYIYRARLDAKISWYYTWDVASGCIWKEDAIKSFERIEE